MRQALIALVLIGLTAFVYGQVRDHEFVDFDDYVVITQHPAHRAPLSLESIGTALTRPYHMNWIPLTSLSLQLDAALWGAAAGPTLLTNAALHALGAVLLWLALWRLSGAVWCSAFVGCS